MICVSYTRTTSCNVTVDTPDNIISLQNEHIADYIKNQKWTISEKYCDEENDTEENAAFEKLTEDGINRKFDMVIIDSLDRCGKYISCAEDVFIKTFFPVGIHFAVVQDNFCSIGKSREELDSYIYKERIKVRTSSQVKYIREAQAAGVLSVHDERYGYFLAENKKTMVIDEEVADVIREIFQMILDGKTYKSIAAIMNERGLETPLTHLQRVGKKNIRGNCVKWSVENVRRIVGCSAYDGHWIKYCNGMPKTYYAPPILDKGVFEKVQAEMKSRSPKRNFKKSKPGILAKKIIDRDTRKALYQRENKDGDLVYVKKAAHIPKDEFLYFTIVEQAIKTAIYDEMKEVIAVLSKIKEGEAESLKAQAMREYQNYGEMLFEEMSEAEKDRIPLYEEYKSGNISEEVYLERKEEIREQLFFYNEKFNELMKKVYAIDQDYGEENSWIEAYTWQELPEKLTKEEIDKWVDYVEVENLENVYVKIKHLERKKVFPKKWFERIE